MTATAEESVPEGDSATKAPSWQGRRSDPTRFILLRHGQTPLSVERRYSGRGNPDLTDEGRRQARAAAARVVREEGIAAIVTSPLRRARSTAEEVAVLTGIDVVEHPGLIENDFGDWEGLTFTEASQRDPDLHRAWLSDITVPAPGGESFAQVAERISRTKAELLQRYPGQTVVLVSHVTPIRTRSASDPNCCSGCTSTSRRCRSPSTSTTAAPLCGSSTTPRTGASDPRMFCAVAPGVS